MGQYLELSRPSCIVQGLSLDDGTIWAVVNHVPVDVRGKKGQYRFSWEPHLRARGCHLPHGITQCYLPPDTSERAPPNPSHAG